MIRRNLILEAAIRVAAGVSPEPPPAPDDGRTYRVEYVGLGHPNEPGPGEQFKVVGDIAYVREADRGKVEALQQRKRARREYGDRHK